MSRRNNYNALDEAAFANEYFTPEYVDSFSTLGDDARRQMLQEQKMTSDGITHRVPAGDLPRHVPPFRSAA